MNNLFIPTGVQNTADFSPKGHNLWMTVVYMKVLCGIEWQDLDKPKGQKMHEFARNEDSLWLKAV